MNWTYHTKKVLKRLQTPQLKKKTTPVVTVVPVEKLPLVYEFISLCFNQIRIHPSPKNFLPHNPSSNVQFHSEAKLPWPNSLLWPNYIWSYESFDQSWGGRRFCALSHLSGIFGTFPCKGFEIFYITAIRVIFTPCLLCQHLLISERRGRLNIAVLRWTDVCSLLGMPRLNLWWSWCNTTRSIPCTGEWNCDTQSTKTL